MKWFTQFYLGINPDCGEALSPTDYGIVSMATAYLGLVTIASEFGIGTAVITLRELTADQLAQLNLACWWLSGAAGFNIRPARRATVAFFP